MIQPCRIVLTGGPGSGKSTLLAALSRKGERCVAETGRAIIQEQMKSGGNALPWGDRTGFALAMLEREVANFHRAAGSFRFWFDRGIPDVLGYLRLEGLPVPPAVAEAARAHRYHCQVFVCPPWPEIFVQDHERRQSPEIAQRTHAEMVRTYGELGYTLIEVPRLPVAARAAFLLDRLAAAPADQPGR
ncbi:AAA family ATPase [Geminicoccus flavidas]|uniref:AAA family ATPase n=1 Tax=Geminicoccus flavidas TaxID=2506407 RepID=UPI00190FB8CC|nr:AAA family ATPase [Geminicoccus flavidas]